MMKTVGLSLKRQFIFYVGSKKEIKNRHSEQRIKYHNKMTGLNDKRALEDNLWFIGFGRKLNG